MGQGVYSITCIPTGAAYIGSASRSFASRWKRHIGDLRKGAHHSVNLQRTWDKHGEGAFEFARLIVCATKDAVMYEQLAIDALRPGLNVSPSAGNLSGYKHTAETREAMSARRWTDEVKLKISKGHRSTEVSAEARPYTKSGRRKLTDADVLDMRALWEGGTETLRGLAKKFGIDHHTAHDICHRKTWRHI